MNFSTDRDLLSIEPDVFTDVPMVGQMRVETHDAVFDGLTLHSATADFESAQVEAGSVVLIGDTPLEVIERVDDNELTVSLIRVRSSDPPIPAPHLADSDLHVRNTTFAPQAGLVHDMLLKLLGLTPSGSAGPMGSMVGGHDQIILTEDAVTSLSIMARLEALGTLDLVYGSAVSMLDEAPTQAALRHKARAYRQLFHEARRSATVAIDTTGDGHPNERRRLGLVRLHRR